MSRFSATLLDHFQEPRNRGSMRNPDRIGHSGAEGSGPAITLFLCIRERRVLEARFEAVGCGVTIACGSMLTLLVIGKRLCDCDLLTSDDVVEALGGVPPDKMHAPALAIDALRRALVDANQRL